MFSYFRNRAERKHNELYENGFNYAAGQLLRYGEHSKELMEFQLECTMEFGEYNAFDEGMEYAIALYESKKVS